MKKHRGVMNQNEKELRSCVGKTVCNVTTIRSVMDGEIDIGYVVHFTDQTSVRLDYIHGAHDIIITRD